MTILQFIEHCEDMSTGDSCSYWHIAVANKSINIYEDFEIYWRGKLILHCNDYTQLKPVILAIYNLYHLEYTRDYKVPQEHLNEDRR